MNHLAISPFLRYLCTKLSCMTDYFTIRQAERRDVPLLLE